MVAKRGKQNAKVVEEEDELQELKSVIQGTNSDDDEEANEDLSLKIVEKALLKRASKLVENDSDGVVLDGNEDDSGVVSVRGGAVAELAALSAVESEAVVTVASGVKKRRKKKKIQKSEIKEQTAKKNKLYSDGVVLDGNEDDSGVVSVSGGGLAELAALSVVESEAVVTAASGVKKRRKKKIQKSEIKEQTIFSASNEEKTEPIEKPETVEKSEAVKAAEEVEPLDSNGVEISDNIVLRKLLRGPRYFDPPDSGWTTCYNCGEGGHITVNCTLLTKKKKPCFICGGLDHSAKQCQKGHDCYICKSSGHRPKDCPEKYKGPLQSSKICLKCGESGHDMFSCGNNYSVDDLKEIQCYMCKSFGHLCCAKFVDNSPRQISCYRCGKAGHAGSACRRLLEEATITSSPSSCHKCGEEGHFARECTTSAKARKKNCEPSMPKLRADGKNKENLGSKSAPQDLGKTCKTKKTMSEERGLTTLWKSKRRGGWIIEDPVDESQLKSKKKRCGSPSTPSHKGHRVSSITYGTHTPNSRSYNQMQNGHISNPEFQASTPFWHRYSASRFGNSGGVYGNHGSDGMRRNYDWW